MIPPRSLSGYRDILEVEAALTAAGVHHEREFVGNHGWFFFIDGELVAQGGAIGLLTHDLKAWLRAQNAMDAQRSPHRQRTRSPTPSGSAAEVCAHLSAILRVF